MRTSLQMQSYAQLQHDYDDLAHQNAQLHAQYNEMRVAFQNEHAKCVRFLHLISC
jgi:hypothetical protein